MINSFFIVVSFLINVQILCDLINIKLIVVIMI